MAATTPQADAKPAEAPKSPSILPSPGHVAYFAGLGLLVLFELIEWPVAVAIGTGTLVAERMAHKEDRTRAGKPDREPSER